MIFARNQKYLLLTPPGAIIDDASATVASIDTKGFSHCTVIVALGATDIALTALKVGEADADSAHADITNTVVGTAANVAGTTSVLPTAADGDNKMTVFEINLMGRKRYLKPVVTVGNGTTGAYVTVIAILSRGESLPTTAADKGAQQVMRS